MSWTERCVVRNHTLPKWNILPPISRLARSQRRGLLDDLNYLNTAEIKSFCKERSIPYTITIESKDGRRIKTKEDDRKGLILDRIRHFLKTGGILGETCFPGRVVSDEAPPENPKPTDRLFYGQYNKKNRNIITLLRELTNGYFCDGAIARIILREFWSRGQAPTFQEYASAWLRATAEHDRPNPEWAFLSDLARGAAGLEWKKLRARKAKRVMNLLNQITSSPRSEIGMDHMVRGRQSKTRRTF